MGAWRLRAVVYGLLAAVSALVLWQSDVFAAEERLLHGTTAHGAEVEMVVRGDRIERFSVGPIWSMCRGGVTYQITWWPSTRQGNVSYENDGGWIRVHERPDRGYPHPRDTRVNAYMRARVTDDRVEGSVWYTAAGPENTCTAQPIGFTAKP